jgi:maltose alpha-D-glucosyltransferase/alpha-amylase
MRITPDWLEHAVFYQIYPQSFADSNGDGIGDLPGIIDRLDYLVELGVTALWINPIYDSPFLDAGYDVRDHFRVADRYGCNEDVRRLCAAAQERGIRVCLDLVVGHTSADHAGFLASARPEHNEWSDRFVWSDNPWMTRDRDLTFISGTTDRMGAYAVNFFAHQPALNFGFAEPRRRWQQRPDAPGPRANRQMIRDILGFWFEHGVDGFRVDLAASLVKADPQQVMVRMLWRELREWLDAEWPDRVLISEWGDPARAIDAGFHVDFMLHFGTPGYPELMFNGHGMARIRSGVEHCWFDRRGAGDFRHFLVPFDQQRHALQGRGAVGLPSANHDFQRPRVGDREIDDLRVILTFLLSWPGVPFLYYGDEIGMRFLDLPSKEGGYQRTGTRTPMQWDSGPNAGFSSAEPEQLYLPVDPAPDRPDVESQRADPDSLWQQVRALVRLRREEPALAASASLQLLSSGTHLPLVFVREQAGERLLVALSPAAGEATFELPPDCMPGESLLAHRARVAAEAGTARLLLDGPAAGIWRLQEGTPSRDAGRTLGAPSRTTTR